MNTSTTPIDILDETLDDLADLPEWKPYPAGVHRVTISLKEGKSGAGNPLAIAELKAIETIELKDPNEEPLTKGTEASVTFTLNQEIGQGKFKNLAGAMIAGLGMDPKTKLRTVINEVKNVECVVVTQVRMNKDKTQKFTDIVDIIFE